MLAVAIVFGYIVLGGYGKVVDEMSQGTIEDVESKPDRSKQ